MYMYNIYVYVNIYIDIYSYSYSYSMLSSACSFCSISSAAKQLALTKVPQRYDTLPADTLIYTRVVKGYLAPPFAQITDRLHTTTPCPGDTCSV